MSWWLNCFLKYWRYSTALLKPWNIWLIWLAWCDWTKGWHLYLTVTSSFVFPDWTGLSFITLHSSRPHSPRLARLLHVVGDGDVIAPHVKLPLADADQSREDAAAVDAYTHVHVHCPLFPVEEICSEDYERSNWVSVYALHTWSLTTDFVQTTSISRYVMAMTVQRPEYVTTI